MRTIYNFFIHSANHLVYQSGYHEDCERGNFVMSGENLEKTGRNNLFLIDSTLNPSPPGLMHRTLQATLLALVITSIMLVAAQLSGSTTIRMTGG